MFAVPSFIKGIAAVRQQIALDGRIAFGETD